MKKLLQRSLLILGLLLVLYSCGGNKSNETEDPEFSTTKSNSDDNYSGKPTTNVVVSSDEPYSVSSGYSTDPDYTPSVNTDGDYHTIDGRRRQIQYQGSQEQQRDLDMIDEYMRTHPED